MTKKKESNMGQDNGSRETVGKVVASPFVATQKV